MVINMSTQSSELNDLYDYGYMIYQNPSYFKFSIDSVLLAEFVQIKKGKNRVLDMCTGNAPVPMILNKIYGDKLDIDAVEIQSDVYNLAVESIKYNNIKNINVINDDIKNIVNYKKKYDYVTCNPPYFKVDDTSLVNNNDVKAIARHEIKIDLDTIFAITSKVLEYQGYFYLVHRPERLAEIIGLAKKYNFGIKKVQTIYDDRNSDSCFILIEAIYGGKDYVKIPSPIFIKEYTTFKDIFRK